jgi:hypothetical protein
MGDAGAERDVVFAGRPPTAPCRWTPGVDVSLKVEVDVAGAPEAVVVALKDRRAAAADGQRERAAGEAGELVAEPTSR